MAGLARRILPALSNNVNKRANSWSAGFHSLDAPGAPERWTQGSTYRFRCYLFGVVPLGAHTIFIERVDPVALEIQSREHEALVRHWDHLIRIRPTPDGNALYSDEIEITAGLLTPLVWAFAQWFYRHRQLPVSVRVREDQAAVGAAEAERVA